MTQPAGVAWPPSCFFVSAPKMEQLLLRAALVRTKAGGADIGRVWVCPDCGTENRPIDCLLVTLHPLSCSNPKGCEARNPTGYVWCMVTAVLNNVKLDMPILNQGDYGTCTAHALIAGMHFAQRLGGAMHGLVVNYPLDVKDLLRKFIDIYGHPLGDEALPTLMYNRIPYLLAIANKVGVSFLMPPCQSPLIPAAVPQVLKIRFAFEVNTANPDYVVHFLAAGIPLVTAIPVGRCFFYLSSGEIYDAPSVHPCHAVLLIGFGVANWPGDDEGKAALSSWPKDKNGNRVPRIFFRCRNSWGDKKHGSYALAGKGGDFDVWADQVYKLAYGFELE